MNLENIFLILTIVTVALSVLFSIAAITGRRVANQKDTLGLWTAAVALLFLTISIAIRAAATGHGPFSNMYEFAVAFAWGVVAMGIFFQWRYGAPIIKTVGNIVAFALLLYANAQPSKPVPLVPALQQSLLLTVHVAAAIIAYGAFTIGFATAILYFMQSRQAKAWMPDADTLDHISYRSVVIGFPFLTLLIVLGALWADIAWGTYWSWDPKETASLVTWLLFASYLHARVLRGWRGNKTAVLLIIGFGAVLLTFFGNYIFSGLHAYT